MKHCTFSSSLTGVRWQQILNLFSWPFQSVLISVNMLTELRGEKVQMVEPGPKQSGPPTPTKKRKTWMNWKNLKSRTMNSSVDTGIFNNLITAPTPVGTRQESVLLHSRHISKLLQPGKCRGSPGSESCCLMELALVKEPAAQVKLVSPLQGFTASQALICFLGCNRRNYLFLNCHWFITWLLCLSVSPSSPYLSLIIFTWMCFTKTVLSFSEWI